MTHRHYCDCQDCRRLWGDPKKRLRRFLRRLDRGEFSQRLAKQRIIERAGKTIVVCQAEDLPDAARRETNADGDEDLEKS